MHDNVGIGKARRVIGRAQFNIGRASVQENDNRGCLRTGGNCRSKLAAGT